jgi:hypothetical protein
MKRLLLSSLSILSCISVNSQQVSLFTTSSKFKVSLTSQTWNAYEHFQFESATSELIHSKLEDCNDVHAVVTGVHLERVNHDSTAGQDVMILDSVVSVTLSEVGLAGALVRGLDDEATIDIASVLSKMVTKDEVLNVLTDIGLADDTISITELTFTPFTGSVNERGIYSTDTELVSKQKNNGAAMFFAGVFITLIVVGIAALGLWTYLHEHGTWVKRQNSNRSVHYQGDIDIEEATTASGVLGLQGHHPQAVEKENDNPNRRRCARTSSDGSKSIWTMKTDEISGPLTPCTPTTPHSVASHASRHPLGITSMRKLSSFMTPQKPRADKVVLYDVERFNKTP